ncbi:hypothetical protein Droror1_Dr00017119 [Drosera rotundifolia]
MEMCQIGNKIRNPSFMRHVATSGVLKSDDIHYKGGMSVRQSFYRKETRSSTSWHCFGSARRAQAVRPWRSWLPRTRRFFSIVSEEDTVSSCTFRITNQKKTGSNISAIIG